MFIDWSIRPHLKNDLHRVHININGDLTLDDLEELEIELLELIQRLKNHRLKHQKD